MYLKTLLIITVLSSASVFTQEGRNVKIAEIKAAWTETKALAALNQRSRLKAIHYDCLGTTTKLK